MSSAPPPSPARVRRRAATLVGLVLLAHAAWSFATTLRASQPPRVEVPGVAPLSHAGLPIDLVERPLSPGRAYVDVHIGGRTLAGEVPVFVDTSAAPSEAS